MNRFPNEVDIIKNGVKNATNKQNWLDLFEFEDIAKLENLAKNNFVKFTKLEGIIWSKELVSDLIDELKAIKLDMGDGFGRFDKIKAEIVPVSVNDPTPDLMAIAALETLIAPNGAMQHTLKINTAYAVRWASYSDYLADIAHSGLTKQVAAHNLRDVLHHELGHLLTTPNNAQVEFDDLIQTYTALLTPTPYGDNALLNANEALAEIFTVYKKGIEVDEDLLDFYNLYRITGSPELQ